MESNGPLTQDSSSGQVFQGHGASGAGGAKLRLSRAFPLGTRPTSAQKFSFGHFLSYANARVYVVDSNELISGGGAAGECDAESPGSDGASPYPELRPACAGGAPYLPRTLAQTSNITNLEILEFQP
jgi:hypothetical protein